MLRHGQPPAPLKPRVRASRRPISVDGAINVLRPTVYSMCRSQNVPETLRVLYTTPRNPEAEGGGPPLKALTPHTDRRFKTAGGPTSGWSSHRVGITVLRMLLRHPQLGSHPVRGSLRRTHGISVRALAKEPVVMQRAQFKGANSLQFSPIINVSGCLVPMEGVSCVVEHRASIVLMVGWCLMNHLHGVHEHVHESTDTQTTHTRMPVPYVHTAAYCTCTCSNRQMHAQALHRACVQYDCTHTVPAHYMRQWLSPG